MKFGRFLITIVRPLFKLLYPFKVTGLENIPPEGSDIPLLLCANHISNIDPVYLLMAQKRHVYYMAKAELFPNKLAVWFFQKEMGAFPVKRGAGDTSAIDTAEEIIKSGKMLGIFPEGTRSKDGNLGRAKSGAALIAAKTGAHILPIAIKTKDQKVKLFQKTYITIGKPLSTEELHLNGQRPDLRYASRKLMEEIASLMGQSSQV